MISALAVVSLLSILFASKGATSIVTDVETVYEGPKYVRLNDENVMIKCTTPETMNPEWKLNNQSVEGRKDRFHLRESKPGHPLRTSLSILVVKPDVAGFYSCHDFVTEDNSFPSQYHEIVVITELSISGPAEGINLMKSFLIYCNVSSQPEEDLKVIWFADNVSIEATPQKYEIFSNNTLKVHKATQEDCVTYTCKVNVSDVDIAESFSVQSKPLILPGFEKSKSIIEGDKLNLSCIAYGNPLPKLSWLIDGLNISDNKRIEVEYKEENKSEAFLIIKEVEELDRADYTCVADNGKGVDKQTILVRVKDKLAALWPFLGIVAEVAVLCTIIFIYEKRRAKQEFDESDTDQSPDTKNVTENKEKDVRQRK